MKILVVDTEGNPGVTEVATILYDTNHKIIVEAYSSLVPQPTITNIDRFVAALELDKENITRNLDRSIAMCDIIVAHAMDQDRHKIQTLTTKTTTKPWICTWLHFKWPVPFYTSLTLDNLCLSLKVTTIQRHTALGDCYALLHCLTAVPDFEKQLVPYLPYIPYTPDNTWDNHPHWQEEYSQPYEEDNLDEELQRIWDLHKEQAPRMYFTANHVLVKE